MSGISGVTSSLPVTFPSHGHGINKNTNVQGTEQPNNPARAARAALVSRTDLASKPLGSIVSLFARGLPLPPMETAPDANEHPGSDATSDVGSSTNSSSDANNTASIGDTTDASAGTGPASDTSTDNTDPTAVTA